MKHIKHIKLFESFDIYDFRKYSGTPDELFNLYVTLPKLMFPSEDFSLIQDVFPYASTLGVGDNLCVRMDKTVKPKYSQNIMYLGDYCYALIEIDVPLVEIMSIEIIDQLDTVIEVLLKKDNGETTEDIKLFESFDKYDFRSYDSNDFSRNEMDNLYDSLLCDSVSIEDYQYIQKNVGFEVSHKIYGGDDLYSCDFMVNGDLYNYQIFYLGDYCYALVVVYSHRVEVRTIEIFDQIEPLVARIKEIGR